MEITQDTAYIVWVNLCNKQDWNDATQITHLEGFIDKTGYLPAFARYAQLVAAEENGDTS